MNNKKILGVGLLAAGALYMYGSGGTTEQEQNNVLPSPSTPSIPTIPEVTEQEQEEAEEMDIEFSISAVPRIGDVSNMWRRREWAELFRNLLTQFSFSEAASIIWNAWNVPENKMATAFGNPLDLALNLGTYIPKETRIGTVIRWDSVPEYDSFSAWWNEDDVWQCSDWVAWHRALEAKYESTYKANDIWKAAWTSPPNQCGFAGVFFCPVTDTCRYDCDFVKYFYSKDVSIGNIISNTYCDLSTTVKNITGSVADLSEGARNTAKTASALLPVLFLFGVGNEIYKRTKQE